MKEHVYKLSYYFLVIYNLFCAGAFGQTDVSLKKRIQDLTGHRPDSAATSGATPARRPIKDSAEMAFLKDSIKIITPQLLRTEIRLDSRASSFEGAEVNIYGYYAGVLIKSKLSIGLAYYRLSTNLPAKTVINGVNANTSLLVNCGSINSELIYFNRRYVSLGFPLEIAAGEYQLTNVSPDDNKLINQKNKPLAFANFGLSGTFKPFKFIGLKLMVGYRKSIFPDERTFDFNGVYTSLGLAVDFADFMCNLRMYRLMKRHHRIEKPLSTAVDLFTD